jgi:hypothetical protein
LLERHALDIDKFYAFDRTIAESQQVIAISVKPVESMPITEERQHSRE